LALKNTFPEARMLLAAARIKLGRDVATALKTLQDLAAGPLTDRDPGFEEVYYWLGQGYLAQGRQAEARKAFTTSLGFDPDYSKSKEALAKVRSSP
jgi:hypothetical protein